MARSVRCPWWVTLLGCLALAAPVAGAETPEQLLATARDGNRAAITAIRTMECRYERVPWAGTTRENANEFIRLPTGPSRFARSGEAFRLFEPHEIDTTFDYVVRDGKMLTRGIWKPGTPEARPTLSLLPLFPVHGVGGEMWQYLLFSHWGREPVSFLPFDDLLRQTHTLRAVERLPAPSGEIRVELSHDAAQRMEFWFDPKANHLVRKCAWVPAGDTTLRWEHEVIVFTEPAPGVFVPTTIEVRCFVNGKQEAAIRTLVTELKVNHDLPAAALRLADIEGLECHDTERRVKYRVDADGNRVGPDVPDTVPGEAPPELGASTFVMGPPPPGVLPPDPPPPTPWWEWGVLAAAGVVAVAIVWGVMRRGRAPTPS